MEQFFSKMITYSKEYTNNSRSSIFDGKSNFSKNIQSAYIYTNICSWIINYKICKQNHIVLNDFGVLSSLLVDSGLTDKEIKSAILKIIEINIENGILNAEETEELENNFELSLEENIVEVLQGNVGKTFFDILLSMASKYTFTPPTKEKSVRTSRGQKITNLEEIQKYYQIIKESYLDKKDMISNEDIINIYYSLASLNIPEYICKRVYEELIKERQKAIKKQQKQQTKMSFNPDLYAVKQTEIISKKEYNTLYHELLTFFDFNEMIPTRNLSFKEVVYCVHLMQKIKMPQEKIVKFIKIIEKQKNNPASMYIFIYEKLQNFIEDETISKQIQTIEEYLEQLFIPETEEDYEFWKECISAVLANLESSLPSNSSYIIEKAKNLKLNIDK